jgi:drug/metabolite transporter (DMT)-like permease
MSNTGIGARDDAEGARLGVSVMLATTTAFAVMDALTKHVATLYPAPQILWIRYMVFSLYGLGVTLRRRGKRALYSNAPWLQLARGLLLTVEILMFIIAFRHLPLADIQAIAGAGPLVTTALSVPILKEIVGIRRWSAIGVGMIGLLIIIRPGFAHFEPLLLLPLGGVVLYALYQILTRIVARHDHPDTTVLYTGLVGLIAMTLVGPFFWKTPDATGLMLLLTISVIGLIGHTLLIKALALAPASVLQPLNYTMIVWAVLLGYVFYDDLPDLPTIVGALIVAAGGLYTFHRERIRSGGNG